MASSTLFRGRRIVDPVPVQRGPSPRDGKYQSSFSDLAAAWENVGEAKSALQAAEARINEANAGLRDNGGLDAPMEEVFSETQRYGRVARYELRPSHFGQDVTSVSGRNNSRRANDFRMNTNRQELSSRAPVHTSLLSPPSKDIHAELRNGPTSRNPLPAFPAYPSDSGVREPGAAASYSSIHRTNEPPGRRSPIRFQGLSSIPSVSSFDDSLEVGGTSASRFSRNESRPTSSLGLRPVIANNSDALARLKERIKLQKEQASRLSPTGSVNGNSSLNPSPPPDMPPVDAVAVEPYRSDLDVPVRAAISKRKVASAPAAPAYKGFSEVESKASTKPEANRKVNAKGFAVDNTRANSGNLRPPKPLQKKAPPKEQRVIAPRRPTDIITTSSWRTGQQTVKRILGPAKKTSSSATSRPQSSSSQDTDVSEPNSLNFHWKDEDDDEKGAEKMNGDTAVRDGSTKVEVPREKSPMHEEQVNGFNSDSELSQHSAADSEVDVSEKDMKELKGNKMLSMEAKNVLSDLELDSDDESEKEIEKAIPESKPRQSRVQKSSKRTQRKAPFNPQSQVSQQSGYPKQKMRHYDADEVKKYMAKQIAERKRKLKEEKLLKKKAVEEKKKKLEELYSRQKKNLQNNLHHKDKKLLGETYSKGRSDLRSIIYPYNHPFQQDELECYSEDTGVSESDKENLDIASFKGLPTYPAFKRNGDDRRSLSSSPSRSMSPEPDQLSDREEKSQVPHVTSVSVGTKLVEIRPSAYVGFPEEKPRDDILATRSDFEPRSSSPNPPNRNRPGAVPLTGNEELSGSPPREDRIAAIKQTAAQLKQRLETEAWRLGLNLQPTSPRRPDEQLGTLKSTDDFAVFKGALPGVENLREQAELNQELDSMTSAATTIQAAFRGHSVRQGLNWKLPSGRTLRSTVREGLHQRPRISGAGASESSQYSTARDTVVPNEGNSSISEINTSYSSARPNTQSPIHSSRSVKDDRSSSVRSPSLQESERRKHITGHVSKQSREMKPSTPPWNSKGGDRLSVINIFTRRNPHFTFLPKEDESLDEHGLETGSLLDETLQDNRAGETASLLEPGADLDQSGDLLEQTLVEESPDKSKEHDEYDDDDFTGSSHGNKREGSEKRTPSPDRRTDEPVYSETFESPENKTTSPKKSETLLSPDRSLESGPLSPTLSEGELSRASEASERSPTFSSTRRSPPRDQDTRSSLPHYASATRPPPSVFTPCHQGGDRLSPGSLDMRLTAELNRLEYMEESVRQLTDVERTRAVSMAQQETVSLAQILKSKQLSHARDMENLRAKAREEALEAAKQLEEARRAAADAAAGAAETIARVRLEAAANISESADRLVKVQSEAARTTAESAKHVEEARSSAARTLLDVARQQTADTRGVAADAASAAAEAAVKSTMARFHEQQEQLLREREARWRSYRDKSRDDRTRDSYSSYSARERTVDSYSRTRTSPSGTDAVDRASQAKGSPGSRTYVSDDLDISRDSGQDRTASVRTASNLSVDRSMSRSRRTPSQAEPASRSKHAPSPGEESGSIPEEMEHSVADSVLSDIALDVAEDDSLAEVLSGDNLRKPTERLERSPEEDYTLNFEESVISSHTATDDEIDFRMILPSESHRRRSLGKTGRSGSIASDPGTVSYSSDDNHDSQDFPADKVLEEFSAAPFSGEDSFSQFTSEMVRLMKEEEVRAKHQAGLLRLREKALKEKTRAEMAWLECQKQRHRDKGADDVMPSIRKRQRGVLMRLQAEQAEIKRLKAANRAASYERRLLLMQQEEIARLRKNTKKIREKAATEQAKHGQERGEKTTEQDFVEQPKSEAESTEINEEFEDKTADHSTRSRSSVSEDIKTASPSAPAGASVAEELPSYQSPGESRTETGHGLSGAAERKRKLSEGDSDEGSAKEGTLSASKGSPTASDSTVMQKLKKLKNQSSERYLTLREQKLMKRRKEAENLLEDKKKLLEWEKRLDKEESLVRNLLNEALSLESSRNKARTTSITSEEEEHKDRSGRGSASLSASRSPSSKVSDKSRSPQRTESISESIKVSESRGHERSASESLVPEDVSVSARDKSRVRSEKSHESSIPEVDMKTRSQGSSIPEEIPEEYVNDTFESLDSTATPAHSTPVRSDLSLKRDTSPAISRRSSTGEGSKSEEETSMTETSDHSDIESRIRRLRDQLEVRKREVKRLYNERKKQRKAMLRAQEASLRQELQAVEMVISRTKAELNRPQPESKRPETGSTEQRAVSSKSESSDTIPTREVRYHLSRTSDTSGSRSYTPQEKSASVSARSEPPGGRVSIAVDTDVSSRSDRTIYDAPSLKEKEKNLSSVSGVRGEEKTELPEKNEIGLNKRVDLDPTDRTRSPDESFSANRRQPSDSEIKTSVRDRQDSEAEIEDEAKTAQDLSVSEESEVRTVSKASYSEKSLEQRSQGSNKSLSVSREKSESDRRSSVQERSDLDSRIPDEAKTADDVSVSETVSKSKSSRSESDGLKKSKGDRSSIASDRKSTVSEISKSPRLSKSSVPSEKSRGSHQLYSSSFESVHSEGDKTEDDISEHISIEEDIKDDERSGAKDSVKDEVSTQPERETSKDGDKAIDISEVPEEISSVGNERSGIKEDVPSTRKTVSVSDDRSSLASQTPMQKEKDLLRPGKNEDQFPSYSADFEPSALDETDVKSDNLTRQASYTPDFDASESNVSVQDDESFQQEEKSQDLSYPSKKSEHSEANKGSDNMSPQKELHRDVPPPSEDQRIAGIPVVQVEQGTDEESIAEELSENVEELEEIGDKEDSSTLQKHDLDNEDKLGRLSDEEGSIDINEVASVLPDVPTPEPQSKPSVDQTANKIVDDLSALFFTESMNCVTSVLEKRRRPTEDLPKESETREERSNRFEKADSSSFQEHKDFISQSLGEPSEEEISDHFSFSQGDDSVSGLDFRTKEREDLSPVAEQPRQETREEQSNAIVNKLSDALLKEAASQMIAIMRTRQEKFARAEEEQSTDSYTPPKGKIEEDEPHSGEESPLSPISRSNRFMAVQRFPDGLLKYTEEISTPPGSPTSDQNSPIDEKELADKLDQLRRLHDHLDGARDKHSEDDDERLEFPVNTNTVIEFPAEDEDEEEESFRRSRAASLLFSVPHRPSEVSPLVASSLSVFFKRKRQGLPIDNVTPPPEIIGKDEADDDLEANSKRVYRRLVFDLTGSLLKELLSEEAPSNRPSWMKAKPRRKRRLHRGLQPLIHEQDFLPVVEQQVLNLIGLGDARPSLERVRRKTPLKAGKKDFVDAILIQELREDEPLWIDYDDDELAVKFQVADAIFESLLSETVMVVNAVQLRREARADAARS